MVRPGLLLVLVFLANCLAISAMATCAPVALAPTPYFVPASYRLAAAAPGTVDLTFIGHASFLIETPDGVTAITDYNDYNRPRLLPDVVTMNNVHSTHYTEVLDPAIKYVLRGWNPASGPARHNVTYKDLKIRNVPTNVRDWSGAARMSGNSIFLFEVASLCIAHLGHLHHTLTGDHYQDLGPIDVALVPVDGNYTIAQEDLVEVIRGLKAPLIIPMHYFNSFTLERFLDLMKSDREIVRADGPKLTLARDKLPTRPTVIVLPGS